MVVRWSVLALALCWLGPFAHDTTRKEGLEARETESVRAEYSLARLVTTDGGALPAQNWAVPTASRDSGREHGRVLTAYRAVLRQMFGRRFLFRNHVRRTPYTAVLFGGVNAATGAPSTPVAGAANERD
jgi:hypothetical protein